MTISTSRADIERDTPADAVVACLEAMFRRNESIRFSVTLYLEITHPRAIEILHLKSLNKRRGHAGCVMKEIIRAADENRVTLRVRARAIPERGGYLDQDRLESFYGRRGFRVTERRDGSADMRRVLIDARSHCVRESPRTISDPCLRDVKRSSSTY